MRSATLQIYYHSDVFVHIYLGWYWHMNVVSIGFWKCAPGYFGRGVSAGSWDTSWLNDELILKDADGDILAYAQEMSVSLVGYPLGGLDGDKGDFHMMPPGQGGVLGNRPLWWRLIDV